MLSTHPKKHVKGLTQVKTSAPNSTLTHSRVCGKALRWLQHPARIAGSACIASNMKGTMLHVGACHCQ